MFAARIHAALLLAGLTAVGAWFFDRLPLPWGAAPGRWGASAPAESSPAATAGTRSSPKVRALADTGTLDGFPDWSEDGSRIVFMRDGQVWVMMAGGQEARAITQTPDTWDVSPVWAPDGSRIAFIRYLDPSDSRANASALMLVKPDGTGLQEVLRAEGLLGYVAWHPQGTALAYSTDRKLVVHDLKSGRQSVLVDLGEQADLLPGGLAWSPDGQSLIYGAGRKTMRAARPDLDLYRITAAGGTPERLTTTGGQLPDFSPDGTRVALRNPRQPGGIYTLELATGQLTPVQRDGGQYLYFHPKWAPDGQTLLASRLRLAREKDGKVHLASAIVVIR